MLGQIERGESSPTVATVWKISNGLKVSFTTLLSSPQSDTIVVRQADIGPLIEDNGKYRLYPSSRSRKADDLKCMRLRLTAGAC